MSTTEPISEHGAFKALHALMGYSSVYHWPQRGTWQHPPQPDDDTRSVAADLVCDLMHYLAAHDADPLGTVRMGIVHFAAEGDGEPDETMEEMLNLLTTAWVDRWADK